MTSIVENVGKYQGLVFGFKKNQDRERLEVFFLLVFIKVKNEDTSPVLQIPRLVFRFLFGLKMTKKETRYF